MSAASRTLGILQVRPDELARTVTFAGLVFCVSAVQVLGRTVRDTLFLARYEPRDLPWMFILYGGVSVVVGLGLRRAAGRVRLDRLLLAALLVSAVSYLAAYAAILARAPWIYPAFYVWADVVAGLLFVLVWAVAARSHTARDAKRLFGAIGAGGVVGTVLCGLAMGALVRAVGIANLVLVAVGFLGLTAALVPRAWAYGPAGGDVRHDPGHDPRPRAPRGYVALLGAMLLCTFTATQIADYQFKLLARNAFEEIELARYFALFYAGVGFFSLFFQLLASPRVLQTLGVLVGLLFMPVGLAVGAVAVLMLPSATTGAVLKFGDQAFQLTVNQSSYQLLYLPLPPPLKARIVTLLDGVLKPVGYALGGVVLLVAAPRVDVPALSAVLLPLVAVWLLLVWLVRRAYVGALAASLAQRRWVPLDDSAVALDRAAVTLLRETLERGDAPRARFAAERLLAAGLPDVGDLASRLLDRDDPELRVLGLRAIGEHRLTALRDRAVERLYRDENPEVRAAAAGAVASVSDDPCASLEPFVRDPNPAVRAAAVAGLLRMESLDCVLAAGPVLQAMAASPDPAERARAARVLGRVGIARYHRPLLALLADEDKYVRRAACEAARVLRTPELVPALLEAARCRGSRAAAAWALGGFGDAAVPGIEAALAGTEDPEARRHLTGALRAVGTPAALDAALRRLGSEEDPWVRDALWKTVARLVVRRGCRLPAWFDIASLLRRELRLLYELAAGFEAAKDQMTPVLAAAADNRIALARGRVLRALEARYADRSIFIARKRIDAREATARANAYEILAVVLDREDKRLVLPYFEPISARQRLEAVAEALDLAPCGGEEFLARLVRRGDDWLKVCALHAIAVHRLEGLRAAAEEALEHPAALVRDAAAMALAKIGARPAGEREVAMFTVLEKLVLLKGVSLFAEVPGEDLTAVVQASEEVHASPGQEIIREGEPGDTLYVVMRGAVRVERGGKPVAHLGPGECFGELAVIDQAPRSATVVATEETDLLAIAQEDFHELLADHPGLAGAVLRVISRRLREWTALGKGGPNE